MINQTIIEFSGGNVPIPEVAKIMKKDKQFVRIDKEMIGVLTKDEIYKQFDTQLKRECKTVLVLKSLKMNGKVRTVWIPRTVAYMLKEWKKKQNDIKKKLGSIYDDNNLVICFEDGNPIEKTNIEKYAVKCCPSFSNNSLKNGSFKNAKLITPSHAPAHKT